MAQFCSFEWEAPADAAQGGGKDLTESDLHGAVMEGAVERVRPKIMTVTAIMASLLPILWSTGTGSEVMKRIAVPLIGGMVSAALLTLLVIPALYGIIKQVQVRHAATATDL